MVMSLWVAVLGVTTAASGAGGLVVAETLTPPNMVGLGARLTQDVVQEGQAQRRQVIDPSRLRDTLGPSVAEALRECDLSVSCAAPLLKPTGARRAVLSRLDRDTENYRVELLLVDLADGSVVTRFHRAVPIAARRLASDVRTALPGFLRGEREPEGQLIVESAVAGVSIRLDGQDVGQTPLTLSLAPGRYRMVAQVFGHYPVERVVDVEAGGVHTEALRLIPLAEADRDTSAEDRARDDRQALLARAASQRRLESVGVLGGAALVSLSTGLGLHLGFESERSAGHRADELKRARNVTLGVGAGLAVGAGLLWLWNTTTDAAPGITLAPSLGPEGVGLGVGGRF